MALRVARQQLGVPPPRKRTRFTLSLSECLPISVKHTTVCEDDGRILAAVSMETG